MKKLLILTVLAAMLSPYAVRAYDAPEIWINKQYDDEVTNALPSDAEVRSGKARIVSSGGRDKKLLLEDSGYVKLWYLCGSIENIPDYMVLSMDIKCGENGADGVISFSTSSQKAGSPIVKIENNKILMTDGAVVCGIKENESVNLKLAVNNKKMVCDVYINGRLKKIQWPYKTKLGGGVAIEKSRGELFVDNLAAYKGKDINLNLPGVSYNESEDAYLAYDYSTSADFIFADTDHLSDIYWDQSRNYARSIRAPKSNTMTVNRLDNRLDPNRKDSYITMDKTTDDDIFIDFTQLNRKGYFPYFYIGGKVRVDKFGTPVRISYIRDTITLGNNFDIQIVHINENGMVVVSNTNAALKQLKEGEWLKFDIALNINDSTADVYLNDELAAKNVTFGSNMKQPSLVRFWLDRGGKCKATFDDLRIIGMRNPYVHGEFCHNSVFGSDDGLADYLNGKTAFRTSSRNIFANGEKHTKCDKTIEKDGVIYASADAVCIGYNLGREDFEVSEDMFHINYNGKQYELKNPCFTEDEKLYIPISSFASEVMGQFVYEDGAGMIITSPEKIEINGDYGEPEYKIQAITGYPSYNSAKILNWYMMFDRPSAEKIKEDFNQKTDNGKMHPRTFATKEDFERIKSTMETDDEFKAIMDELLQKADGYLTTPLPVFNIPDKQRINGLNHSYLDVFLYLPFAYRITGDTKYADRALENINAVINYPDWNPSHLIDTAELCAAVAIAYDWIYDTLDEETKLDIYSKVKKLGMEDIRDAYYNLLMMDSEWASAIDFVQSKSNFNTVINGGVLTAAAAFADIDPDFCFDVLEKGLRSMEYSILMYEPDGAWAEGISYWNYASLNLAKGMEAVLNSTGENYGLLDAGGVSNTSMFIRSMDSYGGGNNFHDCNPGRVTTPYIGWFAKVYNIPELAAGRKNQITSGGYSASLEDALWYIQDKSVTENNLPLDVHIGGLDTVSIRSSYTDNDGLYFSSHGGPVFCYHSQADAGTFVFDMQGVRWASDIGLENYNTQRDGSSAGYYTAYRRRAEAHNVMVFNPDQSGGMDDNASAVMTAWQSKPRGAFAAYDLSDVYNKYVSDYTRGYYVGNDRRSLTIRDEFTVKEDMPAYWFMTTPADVEIADNKTAILKKANKKMKLEIVTEADIAEFTAGEAAPLPTSPILEGQTVNTGYTRLALKINAQRDKAQTITVRISPYGEISEPVSDIPVSEWTLPDGEYKIRESMNARIMVNGRDINNVATDGKVGIVEGEPLPEITAAAENPAHHVEIIPGDPADAYTVVRVYNADKSQYNDFYVEYSKSESADLSDFEKLDITDINVSSTPEEANVKENMVDNDYSTRWTSANNSGEWAIFDLGEAKDIDAVAMAFWRGDTRNYAYEILVSNDGEAWKSVSKGSSSGKTEGLERVEFAREHARFVKFLGGGNTQNGHSNILEFSILARK